MNAQFTIAGRARRRPTRGVTLIELMIAVSLVAVIATGMLYAMRISLLTYERVGARLGDNRRAVRLQQLVARQIGGAMPALGCTASGSGGVPFFSGGPQAMRLVSSYSIAEGARGYPQILEYDVVGGSDGLALVVREQAYTGPLSTVPFCGAAGAPDPAGFDPTALAPIVVANHLAFCRFSYHDVLDPRTYIDKGWLPVWNSMTLPAAVRIEMAPLADPAARLPVVNITVPIRVDRDQMGQYVGP